MGYDYRQRNARTHPTPVQNHRDIARICWHFQFYKGDQTLVPCSKLTESASSSRDEVPTVAVKVPVASAHACAVASHTWSG